MGGTVNPSKLRHRITIQAPSAAKTASGAPTGGWVDFATVWAEIRPLSSREINAAQAVQASTSHEISMRYLAGVTHAMRAVYNGRYFNFGPPQNIRERNIELLIPATEGLNKG